MLRVKQPSALANPANHWGSEILASSTEGLSIGIISGKYADIVSPFIEWGSNTYNFY